MTLLLSKDPRSYHQNSKLLYVVEQDIEDVWEFGDTHGHAKLTGVLVTKL